MEGCEAAQVSSEHDCDTRCEFSAVRWRNDVGNATWRWIEHREVVVVMVGGERRREQRPGSHGTERQHENLRIFSACLAPIRYGVVANIIASHAIARGSIPRVGTFCFVVICRKHSYLSVPTYTVFSSCKLGKLLI